MESKKRQPLDFLLIFFKGMAMGAADVVPGVSGGTIAFISGVYDELLNSINSINFNLLKILRKEGIKAIWTEINGNFLTALLLGILMSVVSLAKFLSYALEHYQILVWSFFFGLVLASVIYVAKQITKYTYKTYIFLILGVVMAYYITDLSPSNIDNPNFLYLMLSGAIAVCAMILPGISGAFILVLLGVYSFILKSVHTKDIQNLIWVILGAVVGILTFSRILKYFLNNYRNFTLAILTGFIIGSLNKIWPWKQVLERKQFEGKWVVIKEQNIWPTHYNGEAQILYALILLLLGFILILLLEKWATQKQ